MVKIVLVEEFSFVSTNIEHQFKTKSDLSPYENPDQLPQTL